METSLSFENISSRGQYFYPQNTGDVISDQDKNFFILINHVTLSSLICLFGIVGNIVNMFVFVRQGLTVSMNTSCFAMTISDTLETVFQVWHNFCLNPYAQLMDTDVDFFGIQYLTAAIPSLFFMRITGWLTVYITAERCLSIAFPLKIKQIVTTRRTVAILVLIYVINVESLIPIYIAAYFTWKFNPTQNRTQLTIALGNKLDIGKFNSFFHTSLAIFSFVLVVILTNILVLRLKQNSKWRRSSALRASPMATISTRERKTVIMVIVIATVMIVCYTPGILLTLVAFIDTDFKITGRRTNIFQAAWSFAFLFHSVNASISILLYYKTSSKYRQTLRGIFPRFLVEEKKELICIGSIST